MDKNKDDEYSKIPVFVFPSPVVFNAHDRESTKQILTIYNPYDFPVRFKVLSTSPSNYTLIDPEGSIKAKNSVDLIVRLSTNIQSESSQSQLEDKFRVQIYNYETKQQLGRRDVTSIVHFGNLPTSSGSSSYGPAGTMHGQGYPGGPPSENFQSYPTPGGMKFDLGPGPSSSMFYSGNREGGFGVHYGHPNYVAVLTALVCIVGLLLPTHNGDQEATNTATTPDRPDSATLSFYLQTLPSYFQLSINQKLLLAYTLGLVTMVIFRPQ